MWKPSLSTTPPQGSVQRMQAKIPIPVFTQKGYDYILHQLLPEVLAYNQPACGNWLRSSQKPDWSGEHIPCCLPAAHSNKKNKTSFQLLPERSWSTHLPLQLLQLPPKLTSKSPNSGIWCGLVFHEYSKTYKTMKWFHLGTQASPVTTPSSSPQSK